MWRFYYNLIGRAHLKGCLVCFTYTLQFKLEHSYVYERLVSSEVLFSNTFIQSDQKYPVYWRPH